MIIIIMIIIITKKNTNLPPKGKSTPTTPHTEAPTVIIKE